MADSWPYICIAIKEQQRLTHLYKKNVQMDLAHNSVDSNVQECGAPSGKGLCSITLLGKVDVLASVRSGTRKGARVRAGRRRRRGRKKGRERGGEGRKSKGEKREERGEIRVTRGGRRVTVGGGNKEKRDEWEKERERERGVA